MLLVFSPLFSSFTAHGSVPNENVTAQIIDYAIDKLEGYSIVVNSPETAAGKRKLNTKPNFLEKTTNLTKH